MTPSIAVIGSGVGTRLHLPLLRDRGCSPVHLRLPHIGESGGHAPAATTPVGLAAEWVVVATPPIAHLPHVRWALDAGARVLCEKPVGPTAFTAISLMDTGAATAGVVAVNYQLRFNPSLAAWQSRGRKAEVLELRYESPARRLGRSPAWYRQPALGGGVLFSIGSHLIDVVHALGRRFRSLRAVPVAKTPLDGVRVAALLQDGGSAVLHIDGTATWARFGFGVTSATATEWLDLVTGDTRGHLPVHAPLIANVPTLSSRAPGPWRHAQAALYDRLLAAASGPETPELAGLLDAVRVHAVIAACFDSLERGGAQVPVVQLVAD